MTAVPCRRGSSLLTGSSYLKIAYIYDSIYPFEKGGGERRIYEIATRLRRKGHEVVILGMKYWDGPRLMEMDGLRYYGLSPKLRQHTAGGRRSIPQALLFGLSSWRLLNTEEHFDVIDCGQWPYFHFLPTRVHTWMRASRFVISWYEVWGKHWFEYLGKFGAAGWMVERSFARLPDHLIAVSDLTRRDLLESGVRPERVEMIPNGIDFQHIRSVASAPPRYDLVCCGRLKNHKNVDVLIDAVAILKRDIPDVHAMIVGDGPERERLLKKTFDLGLNENVTFAGALDDFDDVVRAMKSSRIFVNASTKEGGGSITLFEANACGLPVIAVRCPCGIDPVLIEEGRNGAFVEALSAELIAGKALEWLRRPDLLAQMSQQCIAMSERYDWDRIAAQHEQLYMRLCSPARAAVAAV
jgi:L-malate glycosyltransferase